MLSRRSKRSSFFRLLLLLIRLRTYFPATAALACLLLSSGCVHKQYFQLDARSDASGPLPAAADSVRGATAGRQYARHGRLYGMLVGQHHRYSWAAPVAVPVLRLPVARPGGLSPGKVGGGFNSTSLSLLAANGQAYVLRTVDKDPIRATPKWLRGTFLVNTLRDNVSATNPYGALVVPPLAAALGVPHVEPQLFYVRADDPAFQGDSLRLFRGQLASLEKKFTLTAWATEAKRMTVVNSKKAFAAVYTTPDNQIDQLALLRARLLDGWLGDWDRHTGQWNWAIIAKPNGPGTLISPLPKDRDMVFYHLDDGLLGWLIGHVFLRHWATFSPDYPNIANLLSSGHYLDIRGLNGLTRAQFRTTALAMQQRLPDTLLSRAVHQLPPAAFALEGARTIAALQARREALPALADALYRQLARHPVVGGTAQTERFEVHRYADSTVVAVYSVQPTASSNQLLTYRRTFSPAETTSIQLESLGGDDVFFVKEHGKQPIRQPRLRLYGGTGNDELQGKQHGRAVRFWQDSAPAKDAYNKSPKE